MTGTAASQPHAPSFMLEANDKSWRPALLAVAAVHGIALIAAVNWQSNVWRTPPESPPIAVELTATSASGQQSAMASPKAAAASAPAQAAQPRATSAERPALSPSPPTLPSATQPAVVPTLSTPVAVAIAASRPMVAAAAPAPATTAGTAAGSTAEGTPTGTPGRGSRGGSSAGSGGESSASAGAPSGSGESNAAALWRGQVLAHLDRHKRYPRAAQMIKREGRVLLNLTLDRRGKVLSASVGRGAGFPAFDTEALDTVIRADPLPPPPPQVAGNPIPMQVPIGFYLPGRR